MQQKDLFLAVGRNCRASFYLRDHELTWFANPLDWQALKSIDTVLHLFQSEFSDFFEDIEELEWKIEETQAFRVVRDKKNNIKSIHQFPVKLPLKAGQLYVRKKAKIRYENTKKAIEEAENICLFGNWEVDTEKLTRFLVDFSQMYPEKCFELHNIRNMSGKDEIYKKETRISPKLFVTEYFFDDEGEASSDKWKGNKECWNQIVGQFCLSPRSQKRRDEVCCKS